MISLVVKVFTLAHFDMQLSLPAYASEWAAGADVRACLGPGESWSLAPQQRRAIPTGLSLEIPNGYEIQVRPRSGLSLNSSLLVVNSPGTIDADYRGELKIILGNVGTSSAIINHGDRIAQLVLAPVLRAQFMVGSGTTSNTERGTGGFGSTGLT